MPRAHMNEPAELTDAQKTSLREHGKALAVAFEVAEGGLTPEFYAKLAKHFANSDLVKIRFLKAARPTRAVLIAHVVKSGGCALVGTEGPVGLFYFKKAKAGRK